MCDLFKFAQLNLHRSDVPSLLFDRYCLLEKVDFALFQEPHGYNGLVTGLKTGIVEVDRWFVSPRAGILIRNSHKYMVLNEFCSRDVMAISTECSSESSTERIIVGSAYLPGDDNLPVEFMKLLDYCYSKNKHLIMRCDANAHHTIWGSTDINERCEILLEVLVKNISIMNVGTSPTFVTSVRREVLDLTLTTRFIGDRIESWKVSEEQMQSDHRMIVFNLKVPGLVKPRYRNPRATDWDVYCNLLTSKMSFLNFDVIESVCRSDEMATTLNDVIRECYYEACPERNFAANRDVPWWHDGLTRLRKVTRRLWNRAKNYDSTCDAFGLPNTQVYGMSTDWLERIMLRN